MFEVNVAQIDYLTLTSFCKTCQGKMYAWHKSICDDLKPSNRMQYEGTLSFDRYGTSFFGEGQQKNRTHAMLQVSGSLAESAFNACRTFVLKGRAKVTRLDLQVTVEYDRQTHSQSELAEDLRYLSPNRSVSYLESKSGPQGSKLATVYYGSRSSERFYRIYEKRGMGGEVLLRFEVEYKGKRAKAVCVALMGDASIKSILFGELARLPEVPALMELFGRTLKTSHSTRELCVNQAEPRNG